MATCLVVRVLEQEAHHGPSPQSLRQRFESRDSQLHQQGQVDELLSHKQSAERRVQRHVREYET